MEATAIKYLKGKLEALGYIQQVYGLAEIVEVPGGEKQRFPAVYEAGELQHINFDSYETLSFIIRDGKVRRDKKENPYIANANLITETYPLSIVIYGNGKEDLNCSSYTQSIAMDISRVLENWDKRALEAAGNYEYAEIVVSSIEQSKKAVWDKLTNQDYRLKDTDMLVMVAIEVTVSGEDRCFYGGPCSSDSMDIPAEAGGKTKPGLLEFEIDEALSSYSFDGTITAYNPDGLDFRGYAIELTIDHTIKYIIAGEYTWNKTTATLTIADSFVTGTAASIKAI